MNKKQLLVNTKLLTPRRTDWTW